MEDLNTNIYAIGLPIAFAFIAIEAIYSAYQNKGWYKLGDSLGSIGLFAGNTIAVLLTKSIGLGVYLWVYQYNIFNIADVLPTWATWLCAFLLIDFVYYWFHRASHRMRFLWAIHMNHHSSEEMNLLVAFRQAWFAPLAKIPFFAILPLLALDPTMVIVAGTISTLYGIWEHTQVVPKLGWLEYIIVTPSHHRVHHASNEGYLDKNYANMFIFYDRLFGTFAEEKEQPIYGITDNVNTFNPVKITFRDWITLFQDVRQARSVKEAFQYVIHPPGWKPED
jgi:sterol desaturase/sphingolipid hydroxylase (fatty acid hydroxylase superfamily)